MWRGTMRQRFMNWASVTGWRVGSPHRYKCGESENAPRTTVFDPGPALIKPGLSAELFAKSTIFESVLA